jgi:hypothetical protein
MEKNMPNKKEQTLIGLDNYKRNPNDEQNLNSIFAVSFTTPIGTEILSYLKSITTESVAGPEISNEHLRHLEGQRYIVGLIQRRVNKGRSQNIVKDKQDARK